MYEKYWGLKEKPFRNTPDPKFLCDFSQYSDSLMKLTYSVRENMGAALLTGVFGCGKTLVARALMNGLSRGKYAFAYLSYPPASGGEFLRAVVRTLKYSELPEKKTELMEDALLEALQGQVQDNEREGKETVIILDEAHAVENDQIFEKVRLLLNFQKEDRFLVNLLLVGQPELRNKVANLRQLDQRIAIRCHLNPLTREQSADYIRRRLGTAGREDEIFTEEVVEEIFKETGGIPRRINHLCDLGLMTGFARKAPRIDAAVFRESREIFAGTAPGTGGESGGEIPAFSQP
ncbi:MAG TPA: AAA family ATPase [bacterium]|nr:AAA family ATPase [bacterium]HPJ72769.1 AAA family ATPase [bacterium]HPQ65098.1 AAA family ATPase [bacterium]